jgi:hypothetical protein
MENQFSIPNPGGPTMNGPPFFAGFKKNGYLCAEFERRF